MVNLSREQISANRCLVIAAELVAEYGDKYLPVFEHIAATCADLEAKCEKSNYMRERALEIAQFHGSPNAKARPASSISGVAVASGHHHSSPSQANAPSVPFLLAAAPQAPSTDLESRDANYRG